MNELEIAGFMNIMNEISLEETITISEYFDSCINKASEENINEKWFMQFKSQIEGELRKYADDHYYSRNTILMNNRVERIENGLIVLLGNKTKFKDKIFELYFPCEFNKNFVLLRSIY